MHHGTVDERVFGDSLGMFYQTTNAIDASTQLIHAWTEDGTFHLHGVLITCQHAIHGNRVAIRDMERTHIEFLYVEHAIFLTCLSHHAHALGVSIARKTARVFQQRSYALVFLHFIVHRTLHLTRDVDHAIVGTYHNHVVIRQSHVARQLTVEDVIIDVHDGNQLTVAIYLDVSQRTQVVRSTCHIQGMEHAGKGRQRICSWRFHLSHHVDHNRTGLSKG